MKSITIQTVVQADIGKVWELWTTPKDIEVWNHASDDWECPHAKNDVRAGGTFLYTMSAKDGSTTFDFTGAYTEVIPFQTLSYTITGGRTVTVTFKEEGGSVTIVETFEMEDINPEEMQRNGWQSILNNFKEYVESHS